MQTKDINAIDLVRYAKQVRTRVAVKTPTSINDNFALTPHDNVVKVPVNELIRIAEEEAYFRGVNDGKVEAITQFEKMSSDDLRLVANLKELKNMIGVKEEK